MNPEKSAPRARAGEVIATVALPRSAADRKSFPETICARLRRRAVDFRSGAAGRLASNARLWVKVLPNPIPGSNAMDIGSMPESYRPGKLLSKKIRDFAHHILIIRREFASSRGVPACAPGRAQRPFPRPASNIRWSPRPPVTSLIMVAPAVERRAQPLRRSKCRSRYGPGPIGRTASITGRTRSISGARRNRLRARPGGFAADIDDRGAVAAISTPCFTARFSREEFAAIGKRIGRHVEDAHEMRALVRSRTFPPTFQRTSSFITFQTNTAAALFDRPAVTPSPAGGQPQNARFQSRLLSPMLASVRMKIQSDLRTPDPRRLARPKYRPLDKAENSSA